MRTDQITVLILDMFHMFLRVDQVTMLTLGVFGVVTLGVLSRSLRFWMYPCIDSSSLSSLR